jgi:hypothetical protein
VQLVAVGADGLVEGKDAQASLAEADVSLDDLAQTIASVRVTAYKPA